MNALTDLKAALRTAALAPRRAAHAADPPPKGAASRPARAPFLAARLHTRLAALLGAAPIRHEAHNAICL